VYYGQSQRIRLTYDLPALAPRDPGYTRVNPAFATFAAFATGDPGITDFEIRAPASFTVEMSGYNLDKDTLDDDTQRWSTGPLDRPNDTFVTVAARNDDSLVNGKFSVGERKIVTRSWPGDAPWGEFVETQLTKGIPAAEELIGLPWPYPDDELSVVEVASPYIYGYAGWFLPDTTSIEIGDQLDADVILHELTHLWFNDRIFADRWIGEGFAEAYTARVQAEIGGAARSPAPIAAGDPATFMLATWGAPGIGTEDVSAREAFGYNAAFFVIDAVADEIGVEKLREIVHAADARTIAYRGDGEPEGVVSRVDSRRLLDLFEQVGGSKVADGLFRAHVLRPEDVAQLPTRAATKVAYAALVETGGEWSPPFPVRRTLGEWNFEEAKQELATANEILVIRDDLAPRAAAIDLEVPQAFEREYESAKNLDTVREQGEELVVAADDLAVARAAVDDNRDPFELVGSWGSGADDHLRAGLDEFERGDGIAASAEAQRAVEAVDGMATAGQQRAGIAAIVLVVGVGAGVLVTRRRRRTRGLEPVPDTE
jgi:hypothetical protein